MFATFSSSLSDRTWAAIEGDDVTSEAAGLILLVPIDDGGVIGIDCGCWTW